MSKKENPSLGGHGRQRNGPVSPQCFHPYAQNPPISAAGLGGTAMPVPASIDDCVFVATHTKAEFVVKPGSNVTSYSIHYGRWVQSKNLDKAPADKSLDVWLELGAVAVVVADDPIGRVQFETNSDAVGVYLTDIVGDGSPTPTRIFYRGVSVSADSGDT